MGSDVDQKESSTVQIRAWEGVLQSTLHYRSLHGKYWCKTKNRDSYSMSLRFHMFQRCCLSLQSYVPAQNTKQCQKLRFVLQCSSEGDCHRPGKMEGYPWDSPVIFHLAKRGSQGCNETPYDMSMPSLSSTFPEHQQVLQPPYFRMYCLVTLVHFVTHHPSPSWLQFSRCLCFQASAICTLTPTCL